MIAPKRRFNLAKIFVGLLGCIGFVGTSRADIADMQCLTDGHLFPNQGPGFYIVKFSNPSGDWYSCSISCSYHSLLKSGPVFKTLSCSGIVPPRYAEGSTFCSAPADKINQSTSNVAPTAELKQSCTKLQTPFGP